MKSFSLGRLGVAAIGFALACIGATPAFSQAVPDAAPAYTAEQLEKLVGPIALYPDDLLAITLPSATYPLDLVKAQRFLEKLKKDPKAQPDKSLPDPVLKLLNYPDVVKLMNDDLDWTEALGDAVDSDEGAVMNAIQAFRRKAQGAGNLKSNDKQVITVEKETIVIQPANPEVIYVPQYQPAQVVVYSSTPYAWGYYPTPYPSYSYPYAPGAAFATGLIWGAAIGGAWGMGWNNNQINNNINRNTTINTGNINTGNRPSTQPAQGGQNWRNDRQPTQTKTGAQTRQASAGSRPGDASGGSGASARPASSGSISASNYGGARQSGSASSMQNRSASSGGGAFSGAGSSGASTRQASSRGASSMSSASRPSGGGGARGGGGRR
jgi:hypothetical protein